MRGAGAESGRTDDTIQGARRGPRGRGVRGERPPGPPEIPLIGTSRIFRRDQLSSLVSSVQTYGDVVSYRIGRQPIYLISNPEDIAGVVVGEHSKFMKGALTHELSRVIGRGLVTSEGRFWRRQRKIAAPSFTRRHIERFADTMVDRTHAVLADMQNGPRDVHADMMELTLQIVLHTVFGDAEVPDTKAVGQLVGTMMEAFHHVYLSWRRLIPTRLQPDGMARLNGATAALDEIFYGIIRARRASAEGDGDDLLGRLLSARDDEGTGMTDLQVRDEVATLFLAGHETTALALSFAMMLLAEHPRVQAQVQDEVERVLGSRRPTMADVESLPMVDAVMRESLRLYPPAYLFSREAIEQVEIGGWVVPPRAQVLVPVCAIHRDPRWYEEPDEFRPQRWLDGLADRLPKYTYLPFGGGVRVCVGNHFATLEGVLSLATLVQHLELYPMPDFRLDLLPSVTLRPRGGVRLRVRRRRGGLGLVD